VLIKCYPFQRTLHTTLDWSKLLIQLLYKTYTAMPPKYELIVK